MLIGAAPRTDWLGDRVARTDDGFILTGTDLSRDGAYPAPWTPGRPPLALETSLPGVFAAGDVRFGSVKRVTSATGEGAMAVQMVHRYLELEAAPPPEDRLPRGPLPTASASA